MVNGFLLPIIKFYVVILIHLCYNNSISTIVRKLIKKLSITTALPVVFILSGILLNLLVSGDNKQPQESLGGPASSLGGPFLAQAADAFGPQSTEVSTSEGAIFEDDFTVANDEDSAAGFVLIDADALVSLNNPLSTILPTRDGLIIYKVQKGDTITKIAANFGISLNTIFWANQNVKNNLKPGQELVILPVSGVLHQVEDGDTIDSVAELYGVPREKITKYNKITGGYLKPGVAIVIPGANPQKGLATVSVKDLPSYPGYFIMPTIGWNWGNLHNYNAVDIANACGTPVYAAAEGLVIDSKSYGWNGGYGHYIDIEHPNKVITRYSHLEKNMASEGDYVVQGDVIGSIGNTGHVHGPTGCHLHFEVRGARNPFAK